MHHQLGAERLAQHDLTVESLTGRRVRHERGVLEVLRPDPEDDVAPFVLL